jgi:hypothetical protein
MGDSLGEDLGLRDLLLQLSPSAQEHLRKVLIRDQADRGRDLRAVRVATDVRPVDFAPVDWLRIVEWVGIGLAALGGALLALSLLNGGSAALTVAGISSAAIGWSLRLWAKGADDREARRRLRE